MMGYNAKQVMNPGGAGFYRPQQYQMPMQYGQQPQMPMAQPMGQGVGSPFYQPQYPMAAPPGQMPMGQPGQQQNMANPGLLGWLRGLIQNSLSGPDRGRLRYDPATEGFTRRMSYADRLRALRNIQGGYAYGEPPVNKNLDTSPGLSIDMAQPKYMRNAVR